MCRLISVYVFCYIHCFLCMKAVTLVRCNLKAHNQFKCRFAADANKRRCWLGYEDCVTVRQYFTVAGQLLHLR